MVGNPNPANPNPANPILGEGIKMGEVLAKIEKKLNGTLSESVDLAGSPLKEIEKYGDLLDALAWCLLSEVGTDSRTDTFGQTQDEEEYDIILPRDVQEDEERDSNIVYSIDDSSQSIVFALEDIEISIRIVKPKIPSQDKDGEISFYNPYFLLRHVLETRSFRDETISDIIDMKTACVLYSSLLRNLEDNNKRESLLYDIKIDGIKKKILEIIYNLKCNQ